MSNVGSTWARTYDFGAVGLIEASSTQHVVDAVDNARRAHTQVRALGTRHSFTDLADSAGTLITVTGIEPAPVLDEAACAVTVGAGTAYGPLATWLEARGYALHNMGSLPHISIAGAVATGTHGSGITNGSLSTAVTALEYVGADGAVVTCRRGEPDFEGLVVGLGAYGIVTRVTLALEPSYAMRQDIYTGLTWDVLLADVDAIVGAAYSISVFTTWDEDTLEQVWVKSRVDTDPADLPDAWAGTVRKSAPTVLVGGDPAALTEQLGTEGRWLDRLPHFRLENTPSNGNEIQTEYFVDRAQAADAIAAVRVHAAAIAPLLLVTEFRTFAADDLWLSGAYGRDTLAIHFTWRNIPAEVRQILPLIEAALEPFDARPHWGKLHLFEADGIAQVNPRLADARALFDRLDPQAMFSNAHLERLGIRTPRA